MIDGSRHEAESEARERALAKRVLWIWGALILAYLWVVIILSTFFGF